MVRNERKRLLRRKLTAFALNSYTAIPMQCASFLHSRHKNTPHSLFPVNGALKTQPFLLGQDACKSRSYATDGTRYLQADLMLLTHAGCAFKDPRGRFGISTSHPAAVREQARSGLMKSDHCDGQRLSGFVPSFSAFGVPMRLQFRTAALRSNRQYGAAALRTEGPLQTDRQNREEKNYLYRSTRRVRCS